MPEIQELDNCLFGANQSRSTREKVAALWSDLMAQLWASKAHPECHVRVHLDEESDGYW